MTIVITGASRGIGASLAELYRSDGKRVIGTSRQGVEAPDHVPLDVGDASAFETLAHHLDGVSVDLLICNAGIYPDKGQSLADGYPPEMWADVFAVNVAGVFLTVQTILPILQMSSQPKIAIISSAVT